VKSQLLGLCSVQFCIPALSFHYTTDEAMT